MERRFEGLYICINFLRRSASDKTDIYEVVAKSNATLGHIKWHAPWRCYAFYPEIGTLYSPDCLRDIADFIEQRMRERK